MPQVIPIIIYAAGPSGLGWLSGIAATALSIGASVAVTAYEQDKAGDAARRAKRAANDAIQDRIATIRSAVSARKYVLGTIRTGGAMAFAPPCHVYVWPQRARVRWWDVRTTS